MRSLAVSTLIVALSLAALPAHADNLKIEAVMAGSILTGKKADLSRKAVPFFWTIRKTSEAVGLVKFLRPEMKLGKRLATFFTKKVNFHDHMVVFLFSSPTVDFVMRLTKPVVYDPGRKQIVLHLDFTRTKKKYAETPPARIYYQILVLRALDGKVVLKPRFNPRLK